MLHAWLQTSAINNRMLINRRSVMPTALSPDGLTIDEQVIADG
jgi:hypothetical protein